MRNNRKTNQTHQEATQNHFKSSLSIYCIPYGTKRGLTIVDVCIAIFSNPVDCIGDIQCSKNN